MAREQGRLDPRRCRMRPAGPPATAPLARLLAGAALTMASLPPMAPPAIAGNLVWTGTGPRAKSVKDIVRDPLNASRMWTASFGAGVYRSLDGGATWTPYRTGLVSTFVRCLAVQPRHPD